MIDAHKRPLAPPSAGRQATPDAAPPVAGAPGFGWWRWLLALRGPPQRSKEPERIYLAPF